MRERNTADFMERRIKKAVWFVEIRRMLESRRSGEREGVSVCRDSQQPLVRLNMLTLINDDSDDNFDF